MDQFALSHLARELRPFAQSVDEIPAYGKLHSLIVSGRLPAEQVRGRWYINRNDLPAIAEILGLSSAPAVKLFAGLDELIEDLGKETCRSTIKTGKAIWKHEQNSVSGGLLYISLDYENRQRSCTYSMQRRVTAILDIADDGTLAGVEIIDNPPPPK